MKASTISLNIPNSWVCAPYPSIIMASRVVSPSSSGLPLGPTVPRHCSASHWLHPLTTASTALPLFSSVLQAVRLKYRISLISKFCVCWGGGGVNICHCLVSARLNRWFNSWIVALFLSSAPFLQFTSRMLRFYKHRCINMAAKSENEVSLKAKQQGFKYYSCSDHLLSVFRSLN